MNQKDFILKIAKMVKESFKIREESFDKEKWEKTGDGYQKDEKESIVEACKKFDIDKELAFVIYLAYTWSNDLDDWCDEIIKKNRLTKTE